MRNSEVEKVTSQISVNNAPLNEGKVIRNIHSLLHVKNLDYALKVR